MHDLSEAVIRDNMLKERDAIIAVLCDALRDARAYVKLSHDRLAHTNAQTLPKQALDKIDAALQRAGK